MPEKLGYITHKKNFFDKLSIKIFLNKTVYYKIARHFSISVSLFSLFMKAKTRLAYA